MLTDQLLHFRALSLLFEEQGRPLKPARKERKRVMTQNLAGAQVKMAVNIVRAFNVPIRDDRTAVGIRADTTAKPDVRSALGRMLDGSVSGRLYRRLRLSHTSR